MNAPEGDLEQEILVLVTNHGAKTQLWSQFWDYENLQSRHWDQLQFLFGVLDYVTCTKEDTTETEQ